MAKGSGGGGRVATTFRRWDTARREYIARRSAGESSTSPSMSRLRRRVGELAFKNKAAQLEARNG